MVGAAGGCRTQVGRLQHCACSLFANDDDSAFVQRFARECARSLQQQHVSASTDSKSCIIPSIPEQRTLGT